MGELMNNSERRTSLRVPVQGVAVFYDAGKAAPATVENLSSTGALVSIPADPHVRLEEVSLRLGLDSGRVAARTVRVEHTPRRTRIAVAFESVDAQVRGAIDDAIEHALVAARRRPIIIIDENEARRSLLVTRLQACGMSAFAPATPLDAFDVLARGQLSGCVTLLASCFGQTVIGLRNVICETFPWAVTNVISDDLDATVDRAVASWRDTDIAQLVRALA